jgi:hypothetical protein
MASLTIGRCVDFLATNETKPQSLCTFYFIADGRFDRVARCRHPTVAIENRGKIRLEVE